MFNRVIRFTGAIQKGLEQTNFGPTELWGSNFIFKVEWCLRGRFFFFKMAKDLQWFKLYILKDDLALNCYKLEFNWVMDPLILWAKFDINKSSDFGLNLVKINQVILEKIELFLSGEINTLKHDIISSNSIKAKNPWQIGLL